MSKKYYSTDEINQAIWDATFSNPEVSKDLQKQREASMKANVDNLRDILQAQGMQQIDPAHNHIPSDPRIFVFGSNLLGIHGAGAAGYARKELGAQLGIGEGPTGRTYALPTCYRPGEPITLQELAVYVDNFLRYAEKHPETRFFVSAVGCGIAGFTEDEVSYIFRELGTPDNCDLPVGWR